MTDAITMIQLQEALEKAGSDWIFAYWQGDSERHLEKMRNDIEEFIREYYSRFQEVPDPFALLEHNQLKGMAFFQIDTLSLSVEMKIMVWRILAGCEIVKVAFDYELGKSPAFCVTVRTPYGEDDPPYVGIDPTDFRVLRHFGATVRNGNELVLDGYYAQRKT